MAKGKKALAICAAVLLCALLLFTFLSKSIYNARLPKVEVEEMGSGSLQVAYSAMGTLEYTELETIRSQQPLRITNVLVKEKSQVVPGAPLLEVDITDCLDQVEQMELSILQINKQITGSEQNEETDEVTLRQLELMQAQLARYKATFPADGIITAPIGGTVETLCTQTGVTIPAESILAEIRPFISASRVLVSLPAYQGEQLDVGDRAVISPTNSKTSYSKVIADKVFDAVSGCYIFTMELKPEEAVSGTILVELIRNYGYFDYVVPLSAVTRLGEDDYCIYLLKTSEGLFGEETYVQQITVKKAMENALYMALDEGSFFNHEKYVVQASGPLTDGCPVQVIH